tara:strand:- start:16912 stop:17541 length:630 start_codon:yes stop_codon:yes gene_type:complete
LNRANPKAEDVMAYVDLCWGNDCAKCSLDLIGHDAVLSLMLGLADAPLCVACIAQSLGRDLVPFLESAHQNVARLACYRAGWARADKRLASEGPWPEDRMPSTLRMPIADAEEPDESDMDETDIEAALAVLPALEEWDAGDRGCGELALELKLRLRRFEDGQRLLLTSTDRGAPADIPAWCRLTGNALVAVQPPRFLIERRSRSTDSTS